MLFRKSTMKAKITPQQWQATKRSREDYAVSIEEIDDDLLHLARPPIVDDTVVSQAVEVSRSQLEMLTKNNNSPSSNTSSRRLISVSWDDIHIKRIMGVGGFAVVSLANVPKIEKKRKKHWFAIKCMSEDSIRNKGQFVKAARDLCSEAAMISQLKHENIIELYGISEGSNDPEKMFHQPGGYFLVLQCMKSTLSATLRGWRQCPKDTLSVQARLSYIALQIANGMDYLHKNRIVYRDLKPQNVGIDYDGNVRLFDFGLARRLAEDESSTHGCAGSFRYMAPEVLVEREACFKSDVFSFSILLWEIITLSKPYRNLAVKLITRKDYMKNIGMSDLRPSPTPDTADLGKDLIDLMENGWHKNPAVRPTFAQIKEQLSKATEEKKIETKPQSCAEKSNKHGMQKLKTFFRSGKGRRIMSAQ